MSREQPRRLSFKPLLGSATLWFLWTGSLSVCISLPAMLNAGPGVCA